MAAPIFGYHMPNYSFSGVTSDALFDHVADMAVAAETAGFDMVTVMDHFYQIRGVGGETEPMLESYTTLAALSQRTRTIRLSALVTGVTYRNPALLAKMVTTLDVLSKGRAILGLGAAWNEDEHAGYGFEFPSIGNRMDRLDEAARIVKLMFTEERPTFAGRYFHIDRALNVPRPIQPGGPKLLIGGAGEKRTLRIVAKYADISNWFPGLEDTKRKLDILDRYCEEEGRDPSTILKTVMAPCLLVLDEAQARQLKERIPPERLAVMGDPVLPDQAAEVLRPYLEAGIGGFTFGNPNLSTPELLAAAGELKRKLS
ncbi:MAG TPA: LLM class F420-dependent oxidoreductase [Candidatus Dormibacteraeota bacterium]|nr:LLM class F420-dependent oxidoreductase [Candidatus Dormibacteraeota bacterium]